METRPPHSWRAAWTSTGVAQLFTGFAGDSFQQAGGNLEGISPGNKLSLGVRGHQSRLRFSLDGVYVDRTVEETGGAGYPTLTIPSRFQVNGFLGVQVQSISSWVCAPAISSTRCASSSRWATISMPRFSRLRG